MVCKREFKSGRRGPTNGQILFRAFAPNNLISSHEDPRSPRNVEYNECTQKLVKLTEESSNAATVLKPFCLKLLLITKKCAETPVHLPYA